MPSPFPGMNPYLEEPSDWLGFHNQFLTYLNAALNATLPLPFVARTDVRCYVETQEDSIIPDMAVTQRDVLTVRLPQGVAVMENPKIVTAPTGIASAFPVEEREAFVEIFDKTDRRRVITVVELLSPTNKMAHSVGRKAYREKQQALLQSNTNLVEIDLLRAGIHTVAVPEAAVRNYADWHYVVSLHRVEERWYFPFWIMGLKDVLPTVPVPLTLNQPDVPLHLQAVLHRCYDEGGFNRGVNYNRSPVPPLSPEEAIWARELLHEQGLID